jgi:hypothetical protein
MKPFISLCFSFLITVSAFSQQNSDEFNRSVKNTVRNAVYAEIVDIGGELHKGWLWYADSSEIVISNTVLNPDTLTILSSDYIYRMELKKKDKYDKRFLRHFIITTSAAAIGTAITYANGEAIMVGPGFVFAVLAVAYGLPTAALTAFIPYKCTRNIHVDSQNDAFLKASRWMHKNKLSTVEKGNQFIIIPQPERNSSALLQYYKK